MVWMPICRRRRLVVHKVVERREVECRVGSKSRHRRAPAVVEGLNAVAVIRLERGLPEFAGDDLVVSHVGHAAQRSGRTAGSSKAVLCLIGIELGRNRRKLYRIGGVLCAADKLGGTLDEPNIFGFRWLKHFFKLHLGSLPLTALSISCA
jgi:hypothetical protein